MISYSFGVINWSENELKNIDINIRKMLYMYKMLQIKNDIDRLYVPRDKGGRGLLSVWDSFKANTIRIAHVINTSDSDILKMCSKLDHAKLYSITKRAEKYQDEVKVQHPKGFESKTVLQQAQAKAALTKKGQQEIRAETWVNKPQHGAYFRQLKEIGADEKESLGWLRNCFIDPFSESYICAAQEMALFTKYHERYILRTHNDSTCRICKKDGHDETIYHILSGCDSLAKREYFTRHNAVCKYLHFVVSKHFGLPTGKNWFMHEPKEAIIHKSVDLLYDQVLTTDLEVGANRPDLVIKDKVSKKIYIIDVSCPCDLNIHKMENTKVAKYIGLKGQLQKMSGYECVVIPVVVGGLGAVTHKLRNYLSNIPGSPNITMC